MLFTDKELIRAALYPRAFVLVGLGAGVGALVRWWLAVLIPIAGMWHPATLIANLVGTFLLAYHTRMWAETLRYSWIPYARLAVGTGFCGGLTTYSTLAVEILRTSASHGTAAALAYTAVTLGGGLVCAAAGWLAGRWVKHRYLVWEETHHPRDAQYTLADEEEGR